ncbi:uncharacterized protein TNIN_473301 [Trichonephila inaurata madagascariensis]|uniref:Granulin n=1 Tax=Trichonephila inaurata madagascariensis TaxID=2747483 RepID=A0A8X6Y1X2_9ARAC|nr:uncharacterized protein TNIN_473301 [Trichonephila inaurata madagascariensis]
MITFLLFFVLPVVIADIRCPGGKICPSNQNCCKVNGQYECCDLNTEIPERSENTYAGTALEPALDPSFFNTTNGTTQNWLYDTCNIISCAGTCCSDRMCCHALNAECCPSNKCCRFFSTCCEDGCCSDGQRCCKGWCCKKSQRCGTSHFTCTDASGVLMPAFISVLILVTASFVTKSYLL